MDDAHTLPEYRDGAYHTVSDRHSEDAEFKASELTEILLRTADQRDWEMKTIADVGCGSGAVVASLARRLRARSIDLDKVWGFDISPSVESNDIPEIEFVCEDFLASDVLVDLVTLMDVFEHVPAPVEFLRRASDRCRYMALHVPLDDTWLHGLRDSYRGKLLDPGHLVFLDPARALSLLAEAGLRVVSYKYTPSYSFPSGAQSRKARFARIPRALAFRLNPWLLSKTLGGVSLMVLAETRSSHERPRSGTAP